LIGSTSRLRRLRPLLAGVLGATVFIISQAPAPAAAADPTARVSAASAIVRAAESHLGARYAYGATGPTRFDCSGLVYRVFTQVGLGRRIGSIRSAAGLYRYFERRHLASRTAPQVGDLVIWGGGVHVGIYIGHGRAISALTTGVRITKVSAVLSGFTAYLHTHLATVRMPAPRPKPGSPAAAAAQATVPPAAPIVPDPTSAPAAPIGADPTPAPADPVASDPAAPDPTPPPADPGVPEGSSPTSF
jgi:hypothetical protein